MKRQPKDTGIVGWESLPTRERGLKQIGETGDYKNIESLPTRERGLKHPQNVYDRYSLRVAPHAGAWIETKCYPRV